MYEKLLESVGLTKNESLTYLALLRIGKAKSGEIVKEAKISGGKIYETLSKLIDKGLVKIAIENGVKNFIANHPKTVLNYIKEKEDDLKKKENELEELIPSFENLRKIEEFKEVVSLIKGFRGISVVVYECLEKSKGEISIMGVRSSKDEKFNNFWMNWHRRRVELKKEARIIFSDKGSAYWKFFKSIKHTEIKELLHLSPSAIMIIGDNTFIFSYEKDLTCIHIKSLAISSSFLGFFEDLWKLAKNSLSRPPPDRQVLTIT
jgi:sugar-specific transcriptional regulator TrmB